MNALTLEERFAAAAWNILSDETLQHSRGALAWAVRTIGVDTAGGRAMFKRLVRAGFTEQELTT